MTPGSRSSSGAEDKRAVPRSARAAAPGSGAASPGIRLRSRERRCVPWSGAAFPGAGLHPRSEAVSPGTRFHPRNQAATRRIGLHPPPSQTVSLGTGLLPWGWVLPQSRAASPGIRLHPGSRVLPPDRAAVPVPAAGSAGCGSRTHLPLGTPASPACRFPRIPGPPPAPPEGEEEDTDQHGPRRSGFSRPGRRGLQRRRARAAAGARSRLGRSASPPRPGSRRWAAMARSAPPPAPLVRSASKRGKGERRSQRFVRRARQRTRASSRRCGPMGARRTLGGGALPSRGPARTAYRSHKRRGRPRGRASPALSRALQSLLHPPRGGSLNWLPPLAARSFLTATACCQKFTHFKSGPGHARRPGLGYLRLPYRQLGLAGGEAGSRLLCGRTAPAGRGPRLRTASTCGVTDLGGNLSFLQHRSRK